MIAPNWGVYYLIDGKNSRDFGGNGGMEVGNMHFRGGRGKTTITNHLPAITLADTENVNVGKKLEYLVGNFL